MAEHNSALSRLLYFFRAAVVGIIFFSSKIRDFVLRPHVNNPVKKTDEDMMCVCFRCLIIHKSISERREEDIFKDFHTRSKRSDIIMGCCYSSSWDVSKWRLCWLCCCCWRCRRRQRQHRRSCHRLQTPSGRMSSSTDTTRETYLRPQVSQIHSISEHLILVMGMIVSSTN